MAVSVKEKKDNVVFLEVTLSKDDYKDKVEADIKNLSKNVSMKGFRKGHTPMGLIKKMYGDSVRLDVIQKIMSDEITDFIHKEEYRTIGQPIPVRDLDQSKSLDGDDVALQFELALIPELTNKLTTGDTLDFYKPTISDEQVREEFRKIKESNKRPVETDIMEDNSVLYGLLAELDGDTPKEGGIKNENAMLFPSFIKDDEEKKKFDGAAKNSIVIFSPYKAFGGNKAEISSLLKVDKEEAENYKESEFSFEIRKITTIREPELDQDFFDQAFGPDTIHSEEEALSTLRENMEKEEEGNANFKFLQDLKELIRESKLSDLELAEDTIRAWFDTTDNASGIKATDDPDESFKKMMDSLKEDLFFNAYAKEYDLKVSQEDIKNYAIRYTWQQFANMGWPNAPKEVLEKQAEQLLSNPNFTYSTEQDILHQLVAQKIRENNVVTVVEKEVTSDELHNMLLPKEDETASTESEKQDDLPKEETKD